ncbi:hypothetical protein BK133_22495 [Paenibacillus sp. FSL H8-0548]|uniref:hypothetical protein n=1 Tax=Paenibacillus sp. FSL H8-0548 TaxID=1920422 RepID=UPI00096D659D|nr:hypothetical protein [Paenibacillus sp. FSL H8-0548]OMF24508.1 hypothetical protein BK133_22495 [Paenibacillus sp. FSL H8-0548]
MKKSLIIVCSSITILIAAILIGIFVSSKSYYPDLPIDSVSKREVIAMINQSSEAMVKITEEGGNAWYIMQREQGAAVNDSLKKLMTDKGWEFKEQMGAGFIFEKEGKAVIPTTRMWTRHYVLCQIPLEALL